MSDAKFDASAQTVEQLLGLNSIGYSIPDYQRSYSWGTQQISELLSDLYGDDEWYRPVKDRDPYFLGSIVLADGSGTRAILDGQQRLTTISLLIAVLREQLPPSNADNKIHLTSCLEVGKFDEKKEPKLRLQDGDKQVYQELLQCPSANAPKHRKLPLGNAVLAITKLVNEYLGMASKSVANPLTRFVSRLLYSVELVSIVAKDEGRAFQLFESLNDRGLDLSAADLIKNKVFAQAAHHLETVKEYWQQALELVVDIEPVTFFRQHWIAFKADVRKDQLYDEYAKALVKMPCPQRVVDFTEELKSSAMLYKHIAIPDPKTCPWGAEAGERLRRLDAFRARSCRPALLACARERPDILPSLVKACESATVRYSIVGNKNPNQLERAYSAICANLRSNRQIDFFDLLQPLNDLIPTDVDFQDSFAKLEIGNVTATWREILIRLNDAFSTGETRIQGPDKVHVEHIFPRKPTAEALLESGICSEAVEQYSSRIGNLTLLSGKKNIQISNSAFSKKKVVIESSEIALNKEVGKSVAWTQIQIEDRSFSLATEAVRLWPWGKQDF